MIVKPDPSVVPRYPDAPREEEEEVLHGIRVSDPYRWLEDPSDPRTVRWADQQHRLARDALNALPDRAHWFAALSAAAATTETWPPRWRSGRAFFLRQAPGDEQPVLWIVAPGEEPRVLLDPSHLSETAEPLVLDDWAPSPDGRRLAYRISNSAEESSVFVLDVDTGARLDGPIDRCRNSPLVWLPGSDALCYVRRAAPSAVPAGDGRGHRRVWRHAVGTDPAADRLLFGDGQPPLSYYTLDASADGQWLVVGRRDGAAPGGPVFLIRIDDGSVLEVPAPERSRAWFAGERLCLLTGASELHVCDLDSSGPGPWRIAVPEVPQQPLVDAVVLDDGRALAVRLCAARTRLTWYDTDGRAVGELHPEPGGEAGSVNGVTVSGDRVWLGWTTFTTPPTVLTALAGEQRATPWPADAVRPVVTATVTDRWYRSADGTAVHVFVCAPDDAPAPTLLTAYGGFGVSITPRYSPELVAWLRAGGVFVVANVRGGGEFGPAWHDAARRERKRVTFEDFAAVAAGLVADGRCPPGRLGISGSSNGGLTVAAAMTREPDRYAAVACIAPLLDMVRYEHSGLGPVWCPEYGSAATADGLNALLGYSPYHHVRTVPYPAVLLATFGQDTRVDPLHARKMCAVLQHSNSGDNPVLLRHEPEAGHGARPIDQMIDLATDELTFLAHHCGLPAPRSAA